MLINLQLIIVHSFIECRNKSSAKPTYSVKKAASGPEGLKPQTVSLHKNTLKDKTEGQFIFVFVSPEDGHALL